MHDGTQGWLSIILTSNKKNLIVIRDTNLISNNGKIKAKVLKDNIIKTYNCDLKKIAVMQSRNKNIKGYIKNQFVGFD